MNYSNFYVRLPIILAIAICAGIFVGAKMFGGHANSSDVSSNVSKIREILNYINNDYVDSTNIDKLTDHAIKEMLQKLDPHTSYIPVEDMNSTYATQLNPDIEGIGVSFQIFRDTLHIESVVAGGPSEQAGMRSGDKIVKVNEETIAGVGLTNRGVFDRLRGKKGSKVKIGVIRRGNEGLLTFNVTRAKIPQHSVDVAYMIDNKTGFVKISRFGATVYDEFKTSLEKLIKQGMKQLIIDLRDNGGGYMDRAISMADELIGGDKLIVYTDGKLDKYDEKYRTKNKGIFEQGAVIMLIDEESASASEIMAGALQDNDRALIVGRRSYGKGLVQRPIDLSDGSELRLTISRYYTPSGRSIQKPYIMGELDEYAHDYEQRVSHGELFHADSNKLDQSKQYKTGKGRVVYGGGGIMPDYFVAVDTSHFSSYFTPQAASGINETIVEFALLYANENKSKILEMGIRNFARDFELSDESLKKFVKMADKQNIKHHESGFEKSKSYIKNNIKAYIGRMVWSSEASFAVWNQHDEIVKKAMTLFGEASKLENGKLVNK